MNDLISRADAIKVLQQFAEDEKPTDEMSEQFQLYQRGRHLAFLQAVDEINALPSAELPKGDLISRADAIEAVKLKHMKFVAIKGDKTEEAYRSGWNGAIDCVIDNVSSSTDAEPKWNCTSNFVAEQLDRLRKMPDEERWEFFKRFFEMKGGAE